MPLPEALARFNRRFLNRVMKKLARHTPLMGIVIHRGRQSGHRYETPVLVFNQETTVTFALTYGTDVDWLKNVLAAGRCRLVQRGRERELVDPRMLPPSEGRRRMPGPIRAILRLLDVDGFVEMSDRSSTHESRSYP